MIRIENKRTYSGPGQYVGRPSVLGNPFPMHTESSRTEVIEKYRKWLWAKIKRNNARVMAELNRLQAIADNGDLVLVCWCAPLPCHADVIKKCIEWMQSLPKTN